MVDAALRTSKIHSGMMGNFTDINEKCILSVLQDSGVGAIVVIMCSLNYCATSSEDRPHGGRGPENEQDIMSA